VIQGLEDNVQHVRNALVCFLRSVTGEFTLGSSVEMKTAPEFVGSLGGFCSFCSDSENKTNIA
jgi:hypothetical protein